MSFSGSANFILRNNSLLLCALSPGPSSSGKKILRRSADEAPPQSPICLARAALGKRRSLATFPLCAGSESAPLAPAPGPPPTRLVGSFAAVGTGATAACLQKLAMGRILRGQARDLPGLLEKVAEERQGHAPGVGSDCVSISQASAQAVGS